MTEVQSTDRHYSTATVLSSLVARQLDSDTVQFDVTRHGIAVLVNGELTALDIGGQVMAWNIVLSRHSDTTYGMSFSGGAYIEIEGGLDYLSAVVLSLPETFKNHTSGLLGNFNGDKGDDLLPMGASESIPANSDLVGIHEGFGLSCKCAGIMSVRFVVYTRTGRRFVIIIPNFNSFTRPITCYPM